MSSRNPWGLTRRQVEVMDAIVMLGDPHAVAKQSGATQRVVAVLRDRACERLGLPIIHAAMAWRDYRGLAPNIRPTQPAIPFGLSADQRVAWELFMDGFRPRDIAPCMGVNLDRVNHLMHAARVKIPGERDGQKQAAWRRACTPGA